MHFSLKFMVKKNVLISEFCAVTVDLYFCAARCDLSGFDKVYSRDMLVYAKTQS